MEVVWSQLWSRSEWVGRDEKEKPSSVAPFVSTLSWTQNNRWNDAFKQADASMLCLITKVRHAPPLPTVTKSLIHAHAQQQQQQLFLNFPIVQLFLLRSRMWLHFASTAVLVDRTSCFMWCVYCLFKVCAHISRWVVAQALQRTARWGSHCCGFLKQLSGTDASSRCHTNKSATHNVHLEAPRQWAAATVYWKNTTSPVLISCPVWQSSQTF